MVQCFFGATTGAYRAGAALGKTFHMLTRAFLHPIAKPGPPGRRIAAGRWGAGGVVPRMIVASHARYLKVSKLSRSKRKS